MTNDTTRKQVLDGHPIRVVARRTGLTPHVIRVWEKRYQAVVPERTPTNRRLYSDEDIERLQLLRKATLLGRSIGQVAGISTDDLRSLIREDESDVAPPMGGPRPGLNGYSSDTYLKDALHATEDLDAEELQAVLGRASVSLSQPVLIEEMLVPLMHQIGDSWQSGQVRVAHEHLATAVIRSFMGSLETAFDVPESAPRIVLSTPAGQLHEVGALIAAATASSEGWRAVYLGPNLPAEEIAAAAQQSRAAAVALSIVYPEDEPRVASELRKLRQLLPENVALILGGRASGSYSSVIEDIGAAHPHDMLAFRSLLDALRSN